MIGLGGYTFGPTVVTSQRDTLPESFWVCQAAAAALVGGEVDGWPSQWERK